MAGNHLHFEGDPMDKDAGGHPYNFPHPEEIAGAVDIEPYFNGRYAEDINATLSASDQINVLAAQNLAAGNTSRANSLFALAKFLKAFGY